MVRDNMEKKQTGKGDESITGEQGFQQSGQWRSYWEGDI